jgi:3-hydroxyisobutyryl-CoA hydrolase
VAVLNGVTMGGGAGISLPGMFRLVTDKTVCNCCYAILNLIITARLLFELSIASCFI